MSNEDNDEITLREDVLFWCGFIGGVLSSAFALFLMTQTLAGREVLLDLIFSLG